MMIAATPPPTSTTTERVVSEWTGWVAADDTPVAGADVARPLAHAPERIGRPLPFAAARPINAWAVALVSSWFGLGCLRSR